MAHFAELKAMTDPTGFTSDSHQVVQRVVVVGNAIAAGGGTLGDNDMHVDGENWCVNFFQGGIWKQTSYNNNFRKQYAGKGFVYDPAKDKFICSQPYGSWSLDENDDWKAPITYPSIRNDGKAGTEEDPNEWWYGIWWDEEAHQADNLKGWKATKSNDEADPKTVYDWNGTSWVSA